VRRVTRLADLGDMSVRALQRLLAARVGVRPKWVILRYRIHEALERVAASEPVDWARPAAEQNYSDQAHLVRDFTATVGVPPTAYACRSGNTPPPCPRHLRVTSRLRCASATGLE
jgi:AraC-like DNA-binding protein